MIINFMKMHGLGNDFIVIDGITQKFNIVKTQIIKLANRNFGVGCDQVLVIEPPLTPQADFSYKIFNQDGSEAEQCGNGARCVAKYAFDAGLVSGKKLFAECNAGISEIEWLESQEYCVNLCAIPSQIEQISNHSFTEINKIYRVDVGNLHIVCIIDNLKKLNLYKLGNKLSRETEFSNANINFVEIISPDMVKLVVFERGVGLTLACGSGACASAVATHNAQLTGSTCEVRFKHGSLTIEIQHACKRIFMTGPAKNVFLGQFKV
jgi:diaminopimelate epimerase